MRQTDAFPELHRATRPREAVGAFTAHVIAIDVLAPDVRRLVLQLSKPSFRYRAGQYVSLLLPDGSLRSLSPACAPRDDGRIIFHVQRRPGGRLSGLVFGGFAPGDRIAVDGPFGDCVLDDSVARVVMLATGTGIAPLLAMLEENLTAVRPREVTLFWGGRTAEDLYATETLQAWSKDSANFFFVPIVSSEGLHVQDVAAAMFPNLSGIDVYACGSPRMVESARKRLLGLPGATADRFHADAFEPASPAKATASTTPSIGICLSDAGGMAIRVSVGRSLLAGLIHAGIKVESICGGHASCGTCRIKVADPWRDKLVPATRAERRLLSCLPAADPAHRLACQIALEIWHANLAFSLDPPDRHATDPVVPLGPV